MESGQRTYRKGRKLASSRRRQMREPADGQDAPAAPQPESWSSEAEAELQAFFQDCGAKERGFVTREDLAVTKFSFMGGGEKEPQMVFDWVDTERRGRLSLEEFSSGLRDVLGCSLSPRGLRRRRTLPPQRASVAPSCPAPEEADAEEKEAFLALLKQQGTGHLSPQQAELWQLWQRLRQEEPQLAGNLEGFLAKMSSRLQEVWADKETLEQTLRRRDADHHLEVQRLYEEAEQQIRQEQQQLRAQSDSRGQALGKQMQEALEAKEREAERLSEGQRELEAQLGHLSSAHQEARRENRQLREAEGELAGQLEEVRGQLQVTRGHLDASRGLASWQVEEDLSVPGASEMNPAAQAPEEAALPGLFGDDDGWDQLLSSISGPVPGALQLCWSPPPTPKATPGPETPRVVRQISISKPHVFLFGQKPTSDGAPESPPGVLSGALDTQEAISDGQDVSPGPPGVTHSLESSHRPGPGAEAGLPAGQLGVPSEKLGGLVTAAPRLLTPLVGGDCPPPQAPGGPSKGLQAFGLHHEGAGPAPATLPRWSTAVHHGPCAVGSEPGLGSPQEELAQSEPRPVREQGHHRRHQAAHDQALRLEGLPACPLQGLQEQLQAKQGKAVDPGGQDPHVRQAAKAQGLETGHPEPTQTDPRPASPSSDPLLGESLPAGGSPAVGAQHGTTGEPQEPPQTLPALVEPEAQPREPGPTTTSVKPGEASGPVAPGPGVGKARLPSSRRDPAADEPQADPDYLFHIVFLGDSSVGKTSFLHLLHQDTFATGLAATVGVDFRVKTLMVDSKRFALQLWDTAGQERYHSVTRQLLRKADGAVLMYDVTSWESFAHVRYWLDCLQESGADGVAVLLLGNKADRDAERQVPTEAGRQLAQELGVSFEECSAILGHNILEPMVNLARSLRMQEERLKGSLLEAAPQKPSRRAGCCS
ncbi:ras-related protein Rab-44 [Ctenodactylus gundi]